MKRLNAILFAVLLLILALSFGVNVREAGGSAYAYAAGGVQPAATPPRARLAAAQEQLLSHDGVTLRYKEAGAGDPVVLIHGYTANLESLAPFAEGLVSSHRVIALDVRGFGKSSKFAEPTRFGQHMVDDVVRLMDHMKVSRAHLVGHSMGALIAANVAARYPARVTSATLVAGPFYADKPTFEKEAARWSADLESGKGLTNFLQWLFPAMPPAMVGGMSAQSVKANDLPSLIAVMRSLPDLAIPELRAAGVPALAAVGTGDPLHPLSVRLAKSSPAVTLLEMDGADHITVLARPELARAMRELLERATAGSKPLRDAA
jgi:pimeloyl-ACP methyl ester carboxylesterase